MTARSPRQSTLAPNLCEFSVDVADPGSRVKSMFRDKSLHVHIGSDLGPPKASSSPPAFLEPSEHKLEGGAWIE